MVVHSYSAGCTGIALVSLLVVLAAQPARRVLSAPGEPQATGLLTTRLNGKQRALWADMERLISSTAPNGQPLYPTIYKLWQQAVQSRHAIYIELHKSRMRSGFAAGQFRLEKFDPLALRHEMVIQLRLSVINDAASILETVRANGFRPFRNLSRLECYVEVLGHELAHLAWALHSFARMQQMEEMIEKTNRLILAHYRRPNRGPLSRSLLQRVKQRDAFLIAPEAEAEAMEEQIWRELIRAQKSKRNSARISNKEGPTRLFVSPDR